MGVSGLAGTISAGATVTSTATASHTASAIASVSGAVIATEVSATAASECTTQLEGGDDTQNRRNSTCMTAEKKTALSGAGASDALASAGSGQNCGNREDTLDPALTGPSLGFNIPLSDADAGVRESRYMNQFVRNPVIYGGGIQGAKPHQEDAYFYWSSPSGKVIVGGVFDGHGGYNGKLASNTARSETLAFLEANRFGCEDWDEHDWKPRFEYLFARLHEAIRMRLLNDTSKPGEGRERDANGVVRTVTGEPIHGGTTASIVVQSIQPNGEVLLMGANVGDSTALYVNHTDSTFTFLTVDHGPENPDEYRRIMALPESQYPQKLLLVYDVSSIPRKYDCPRVFKPDGTKDMDILQNPWQRGLHPTNVRYEPAVYAVTPREVVRDSTCIAMTRALGDFYAHQYGLTYEPSITVKRVQPNQRLSIWIASDGVWDCWKYNDWARGCSALLSRYNGVTSPAYKSKAASAFEGATEDTFTMGIHPSGTLESSSSLLELSLGRARASFGESSYDDATLVSWQYPCEVASNSSQHQQQQHP